MWPFRLIVLFFVAVLLSACQWVSAAEPVAMLDLQYVAATKRNTGPYVLGPADRVRIKVYNENDISGEYEVSSSGFISVPLAGPIKAAGLTTALLERAIRSRLAAGIVNDPRVNVEMAAYAPFYIQGEVKTSGEYAYRIGLTVQNAIALAGGYTYRANDREVYIRRAGSAVEEIYGLGLPISVSPGDNIRIPERYF